jgi:DNA modification methylase
VGMPWRVAFALQADGWYLRSDIIWSKPNPMPESVTDRPTKSHEYIFLLTKKARYYYDADAVREAHEPATIERAKNPKTSNPSWHTVPGTEKRWNVEERKLNPAGRNRRTVWEIATQPFPMAHFATFPEALVEPCIKAGTSERGCCSVCGSPWKMVVDVTGAAKGQSWSSHTKDLEQGNRLDRGYELGEAFRRGDYKRETKGWQPSCSCNADTVPCVVLDPFGGSGTVGKVARDLNRKAILIELNAEYIKIARERLRLNEQLGEFA